MRRVPPSGQRMALAAALAAAGSALLLSTGGPDAPGLLLAAVAASAAVPFLEWRAVPAALARALPRVAALVLLVTAVLAWLSRSVGTLVVDPAVFPRAAGPVLAAAALVFALGPRAFAFGRAQVPAILGLLAVAGLDPRPAGYGASGLPFLGAGEHSAFGERYLALAVVTLVALWTAAVLESGPRWSRRTLGTLALSVAAGAALAASGIVGLPLLQPHVERAVASTFMEGTTGLSGESTLGEFAELAVSERRVLDLETGSSARAEWRLPSEVFASFDGRRWSNPVRPTRARDVIRPSVAPASELLDGLGSWFVVGVVGAASTGVAGGAGVAGLAGLAGVAGLASVASVAGGAGVAGAAYATGAASTVGVAGPAGATDAASAAGATANATVGAPVDGPADDLRVTQVAVERWPLLVPRGVSAVVAPAGLLERDSFGLPRWYGALPQRMYGARWSGLATGPSEALPPQERAEALALPPYVDPRLLELARELAARGSTTRERIAATTSHLQSGFRYTLAPGAFLTRDPLAEFLFEKRAGYCEYFASAGVVLLRLQGVPARFVKGLSVGPQTDQGGGLHVVRESDAHAWVEAWVPGEGWVEADPTPPGQLAASRPPRSAFARWREHVRAALGQLWARVSTHGPLDAARWVVGRAAAILDGLVRDTRTWLVVGALVGGYGLARVFRTRVRRPKEPARDAAEAAVSPDLRALVRALEARWVAAGHPRPPGRGLREHALRFAGRRGSERESPSRPLEALSPSAAAAADIVEAYYRARFGGHVPSAQEVRRLRTALSPVSPGDR